LEGSRFVRIARESDIAFIANNMRKSDALEVWASHRHTPIEAMQNSFNVSALRWTIEHNRKPVAMFGVGVPSAMSDSGYPWLLGTDLMYAVRFEFLKWSKYYVEVMRSLFDHLENWVDARNTLSVRWLRWCGFEIKDAEPWGPDQIPFHYFSWSVNHV